MHHPRNVSKSAFRPLALAVGLALSVSVGAEQCVSEVGMCNLAPRGAPPSFLARVMPAFPRPRSAANTVVENCNDAGPGSLRDAMLNSIDGEAIDLTELTCSLITLTSGQLIDPASTHHLALYARSGLVGGVVRPGLTIDAQGTNRVMTHLGDGVLILDGIRVTNGLASFAGAKGGCIYSPGSVELLSSEAVNCRVHATAQSDGLGGAIYASAAITLVSSTISGNVVSSDNGDTYGGGLFTRGLLIAAQSTIEGNAANHLGYGGGMAAGSFKIYDSTVAYNTADFDGAMTGFSNVPSLLSNSTITGNSARGGIGGIEMNGPLVAVDSTIASNTSDATLNRASGVFMDGNFALTAHGTIIANNFDGARPADVGGQAAVTGQRNLVIAHDVEVPSDTIAGDPMLQDLADNGGPTQTRALASGSPAIDNGLTAAGIDFDQRGEGFARQVGPSPDIGAFEYQTDTIFLDGFELCQ